jgi:flagellar M-ring protein FliF
VNLMNAAFASEKIEIPDLPLWKQPEVLDTVRSFAWPVGTLLLAAMVLMGMVRPAMQAVLQAPPRVSLAGQNRNNQLDALESEQPERPQLVAPKRADEPVMPSAGELQLEDARKLTRDNPAAVANIVKAWMNGEVPA